jgi:hypothetical protein
MFTHFPIFTKMKSSPLITNTIEAVLSDCSILKRNALT